MPQNQIEVELKAALASQEEADKLRLRMLELDPSTKFLYRRVQLTHYFAGGNLEALAESVAHRCFSEERCLEFTQLAKHAKHFSVRTRQEDNAVFLIMKISLEDEPATNAASRLEFQENVTIPLSALDALILGSGFTYQSKWSREREAYQCRGVTVLIDKNAGYGFIAEFEKMVDKKEDVEPAKKEIRALMGELKAPELSRERLDRMFEEYSAHWQDYYGTDKTFAVADA